MGLRDRVIEDAVKTLEFNRSGEYDIDSHFDNNHTSKYEKMIRKAIEVLDNPMIENRAAQLRKEFDYLGSVNTSFSYMKCPNASVSYLGYGDEVVTDFKGKKDNQIETYLLTDFIYYVGFLKYVKDNNLDLNDFGKITGAYSSFFFETSIGKTEEATERIMDFFKTNTEEIFTDYFKREFIDKYDMNETQFVGQRESLKEKCNLKEEPILGVYTTTTDLVKLGKVIIDENLLPENTRNKIVGEEVAKSIKNLKVKKFASTLLSNDTFVLMDDGVGLAIDTANGVVGSVIGTPLIASTSVEGLLTKATEQSLVEQTSEELEEYYTR